MASPSAVQLSDGVYLYATLRNGVQSNYLSFLEPEHVYQYGLAGEAIIGEVDSSLSISPGHFARNSVFKDFLHRVIARVASTLPELQWQASQEPDGSLFIIDARVADPNGDILPEDILGVFRVTNGKIVPGSYQMNPNHQLVSQKGLFRLHPAIHAELLRELRECRPP